MREQLCQNLDKKEHIRVVIETDHEPLLKKNPWHKWDLFANIYTKSEVALCSSEYEQPRAEQTSNLPENLKFIITDESGNSE